MDENIRNDALNENWGMKAKGYKSLSTFNIGTWSPSLMDKRRPNGQNDMAETLHSSKHQKRGKLHVCTTNDDRNPLLSMKKQPWIKLMGCLIGED